MIKRNNSVPNTSTSLQTTLATEAYLAEGQFLLEQRTMNSENSLIYRGGSRRATISERIGQNLEPRHT
jgi:hypothetical protein